MLKKMFKKWESPKEMATSLWKLTSKISMCGKKMCFRSRTLSVTKGLKPVFFNIFTKREQ